jgi:MoxR-like ATPase
VTQPTTQTTSPDTGAAPAATSDSVRNALLNLRGEIAKAVVGQDAVVSGLVIALLCRGHVLLEGVPGVAKTLLVRTLAAALQLEFKRVQFTPDLMPGDVTGSLVYDARTAEFEFRSGPVFTNLLLADEINRTPPKTQAALLEAMEERQVSVEGEARPLPDPFIVAATQNPIEYEGTYQLPEAQLDRFLLKLNVPLPPRDQEIAILDRHARGFDPRDLSAVQPVAAAADLAAGREAVHQVLVADEVLGYIVDIVGATRHSPSLQLGVSPRGATALRVAPTSPPTMSRRWRARRCGIGSGCDRRPNWRAPTPTACSRAYSRPCRCHASDRHRPHRPHRADLRAADRVLAVACNRFRRVAGRAFGGGDARCGAGGKHAPLDLLAVR